MVKNGISSGRKGLARGGGLSNSNSGKTPRNEKPSRIQVKKSYHKKRSKRSRR